MMVYVTLFSSAFLAATLLPASSEVLLITFINQGHPALALWLTATLGNTLGACANWVLGRYFSHYRERKWFPVKAVTLTKAERGFQRYGQWSLLFSWLPIVGDALTLMAGLLRVPFPIFVILTALGKGARYAVLIAITRQLLTF
ncbi:MAG TPA: YqaA family protein [Marinagarivorans sp.]